MGDINFRRAVANTGAWVACTRQLGKCRQPTPREFPIASVRRKKQNAGLCQGFLANPSMKIVRGASTKVNEPWEFQGKGADLQGGNDMRLASPQQRLDC